ncbi:MAG: ABC transporter permease, partial [Bacteroidota bacterium]
MSETYHSPKWARTLLRQIYDEEMADEIIGDFEEVYKRRLQEDGPTSARFKYWRDAILALRNLGLRKRKPQKARFQFLQMLSNYVVVSLRMMRRNPGSSLISILGLSTAIGCTIVAFLWADFQSHLDTFHQKGGRIYQVTTHKIEGEGIVKSAGSPLMLSQVLREGHAGVERAAAVKIMSGHFKVGTQVHTERVMFTDPSFLQIFDFPMRSGNKGALSGYGQVVLSEEMAKKYFGETNPLNQTVSIKFEREVQNFTVAGVFSRFPENASFQPAVVLPLSNYLSLNSDPLSWSDWSEASFVLTKPGITTDQFDEILQSARQAYNLQNPLISIDRFEWIPLVHLASRSQSLERPLARGAERSDYMAMLLTAVLMLVLACFNYMNVAVSSATKRLREVAIRKTMGGNRRSILMQFLIEHLVISGLALFAGVLLSYFLLLPGFNTIAPVALPFAFSSWSAAFAFFVILWLSVTIAAGAYPAFYISRFQPSTILAGKQRFGSRNYLSRALLTLQLFLSFTMVIGSLVFTDNALFVKELDWGYTPDHLLSVRLTDPTQYDLLVAQAQANDAISSIGGSKGHLGVSNPSLEYAYLDRQFRTLYYDVSPGYLEALGAVVQEGQLFDDQLTSNDQQVVINQEFARKMGWDDPLGKQIRFDEQLVTVIGIVGNMRHAFFSADDVR